MINEFHKSDRIETNGMKTNGNEHEWARRLFKVARCTRLARIYLHTT